MPQVQFKNVQAPDFSATARLLQGANQSLNQGFSAASGLLATYQKGQTEKADIDATNALAGVKSIEEFDALLQTPGFGQNISAEQRKNIGEFRQSFADLQGTKATNELTAAQQTGTEARTAQTIQQTSRNTASEANDAVVRANAATDRQTKEDKEGALTDFTSSFSNALLEAQNGTLSSDDKALVVEAINSSGLLTPTQASGFLKQLDTAERQRKTDANTASTRARTARNDRRSEEARVAKESTAAATLAAILNPENQSTSEVQRSVLNSPALANALPSDRLAAIGISGRASEGAGAILSPDTPTTRASDIVNNVVTGVELNEQNKLASNQVLALQEETKKFKKGDPTEVLIDKLQLGNDDQGGSKPKFRANINKFITRIAAQENTDRATVAAAMERNHVLDPFGLNRGSFGFGSNISRRFPEDDVVATIRAGLDRNAVRDANELKLGSEANVKEIKTLRTKLVRLKKQAAKTKGGGSDLLLAEIQQITNQINNFPIN